MKCEITKGNISLDIFHVLLFFPFLLCMQGASLERKMRLPPVETEKKNLKHSQHVYTGHLSFRRKVAYPSEFFVV